MTPSLIKNTVLLLAVLIAARQGVGEEPRFIAVPAVIDTGHYNSQYTLVGTNTVSDVEGNSISIGSVNFEARSINNHGVIVGKADNDGGVMQAFVFDTTNIILLDTFGNASLESVLTAINDNGYAVGYSERTVAGIKELVDVMVGGTQLRSRGRLSDSLAVTPLDVNEYGQVVGEALMAPGVVHGFYFREGDWVDLQQTLGGSRSGANGINDKGYVVGWRENKDGNIQPFLYDANNDQLLYESMLDFSGNARDINNDDVIVGQATGSDGMHYPYVYVDGWKADINQISSWISGASAGPDYDDVKQVQDDGGMLLTKSANNTAAFALANHCYLIERDDLLENVQDYDGRGKFLAASSNGTLIIFELIGHTWRERKRFSSGSMLAIGFGGNVQVGDEHILLTAQSDVDNNGALYAYRLASGSWREDGRITPPAGYQFTAKISLHGNALAVVSKDMASVAPLYALQIYEFQGAWKHQSTMALSSLPKQVQIHRQHMLLAYDNALEIKGLTDGVWRPLSVVTIPANTSVTSSKIVDDILIYALSAQYGAAFYWKKISSADDAKLIRFRSVISLYNCWSSDCFDFDGSTLIIANRDELVSFRFDGDQWIPQLSMRSLRNQANFERHIGQFKPLLIGDYIIAWAGNFDFVHQSGAPSLVPFIVTNVPQPLQAADLSLTVSGEPVSNVYADYRLTLHLKNSIEADAMGVTVRTAMPNPLDVNVKFPDYCWRDTLYYPANSHGTLTCYVPAIAAGEKKDIDIMLETTKNYSHTFDFVLRAKTLDVNQTNNRAQQPISFIDGGAELVVHSPKNNAFLSTTYVDHFLLDFDVQGIQLEELGLQVRVSLGGRDVGLFGDESTRQILLDGYTSGVYDLKLVLEKDDKPFPPDSPLSVSQWVEIGATEIEFINPDLSINHAYTRDKQSARYRVAYLIHGWYFDVGQQAEWYLNGNRMGLITDQKPLIFDLPGGHENIVKIRLFDNTGVYSEQVAELPFNYAPD